MRAQTQTESSLTESSLSPTVRGLALALIAIGALLMVGAVFADQLGLTGGGEGFGWKQLIGAIAGLVLLIGGLAWLLQPLAGSEPELEARPASDEARDRRGGFDLDGGTLPETSA
jgi:predicted phage tail protein